MYEEIFNEKMNALADSINIKAGTTGRMNLDQMRESVDNLNKLPNVDQDDDGKVLAVVNGEWNKATIPSGNLPPVSVSDDGKVLVVTGGEWGMTDALAVVVSETETKTDVIDYAFDEDASHPHWVEGKYVVENGTEYTNATYYHTQKIAVNEGDIVYIRYGNNGYVSSARFVTAYKNNEAVSALGGANVNVKPYTVPAGVDELIFSVSWVSDFEQMSRVTRTYDETTVTITPKEKSDVDDLIEFKEAVSTTETVTETVTEDIVVQPWTSGYMVQNGTVAANSSYIYSQHIGVNVDDVIVLKRADSGLVESARYVTVFANGAAVEALGGENVPFPYTVPNGAEEVVFSISSSYQTTTVGTKTYTETEDVIHLILEPEVNSLFEIVANKKPNKIEYSFDLTAGTPYQATDNLEDMADYEIVFNGKFNGTYSGVTTIDKAGAQTYGGAFAFDDTNLYEYTSGNASTPVRTQAHGLILKDYVGVIITLDLDGKAHVTLSTNGGTYTWNVPYWRSNYGVLKASSTLTSFSDCTLSYSVRGLRTENWLYGDSYFGNTDTSKWTSYLVSLGFKNYHLNGYAGRNSATALTSLKKDLSMNRTPKRIIWCLGMNDSDKDYLPDPNPNWKAAVDELVEICEDKHIELILATIPNVTNTDYVNSAKNAYVVASGYRYIDFANAISADGSSTWYDDMLNSDGIHPKTQGAIALFNCAVAEVPELLS